MYQLITKKDQRYWLSHQEVVGIRMLLQRGVNFITLERYDKTINTFDIHEIGIPDWAYPMVRAGHIIEFDGDIPVVRGVNQELRFEDGHWQIIEGKSKREYKSFEDYIGIIKKLN